MNKTTKVAAILTGALIFSQIGIIHSSTVDAATTTKKKTTVPASNLNTLDKLSPIRLTSKSYVKLSDVNILTQDEGNILTYTLNFYNGDQKDIQLIDYWSKVKTKSGSVLSSQLVSKDKTKKKIAPQSQVTLTYYARIGNINSVNDLMFDLIKWDFSKANYENVLGTFKVPATFTALTSLGQTKKLRINDIPVQTKLESHQIYKTNDKIYTMVTLSMQNLGYKVVEDPKFSFNVVTTDGASYALSTDMTGTNFRIQPQEKKNVQLIAELPASAKTDKLKLQIVMSDDELKQNLPVATYSIPAGQSTSLLIDGSSFKTLEINGNKVETQIKGSSVSADEDNANWSATLYFRNTGNKTLTLPKYEATLSSAEGYLFPIVTKSFDSITLKPLEEKTISLNATIPAYLKQDKIVLQLNQTTNSETDQAKVAFPVAFYALPYRDQINANEGTVYYVENSYGKFNLKLSSIQMLPWSDGDLVSAKFTISNVKATTVKLPQLAGVLKLDQANLNEDTQVIATTNSMILGPYGQADLYLLAKVPNGLDYKQTLITLQEKNGENLLDFLTVATTKSQNSVPSVAKGTEYHITTAGKNAEVKERRTVFYSGISSNVLYTELEVKSEETRQADLSHLVGYYKTKDGQYFEAIASQPEASTSPSGKNLVTMWAKLPRNLDTSDMVLYIGEGVKDGKFTAPKGETTGYVNAVALELNQQKLEPKRNSLSAIDLFPYNLSIPNLSGTLAGGSLNVKFDYYLSRNGEYEIGTFDHKLVLELRDAGGKYFEHELTLEQDLKVGDNQTYSLNFSDSIFEGMQGGSFEISLYDKFQGEKVKLASQAFYYSGSNANLN
ncbi:hypothetical protein GNP92_16810 [Paenibacillus timonensis]|nr:hypothetical protein [Paenibacillus timonensis]MUG88007.1 hypothetical protein [Paenibacillus timonensis]